MPDRDARERLLEALAWFADAVQCGRPPTHNAAKVIDALDAYVDERIANKTSAGDDRTTPPAAADGGKPGAAPSTTCARIVEPAPQRVQDCGIPSPAPARDREAPEPSTCTLGVLLFTTLGGHERDWDEIKLQAFGPMQEDYVRAAQRLFELGRESMRREIEKDRRQR